MSRGLFVGLGFYSSRRDFIAKASKCRAAGGHRRRRDCPVGTSQGRAHRFRLNRGSARHSKLYRHGRAQTDPPGIRRLCPLNQRNTDFFARVAMAFRESAVYPASQGLREGPKQGASPLSALYLGQQSRLWVRPIELIGRLGAIDGPR